jgi:Uma2 family endonuclease
MSVKPLPRYTPLEYLAIEREAEYKSEYYNGEIFPMSGASRYHVAIITRIIALLYMQLRGTGTEVYSSDMRVWIESAGLYTYPDVAVVSERPEFQDNSFDNLLNPTLIIEVLSDSTERYDRGRKFAFYRTIPSLRTYVLVSQYERLIERYDRQGNDTWNLVEARGSEVLKLDSIGGELPLDFVYEQITFDE